MSMHAPKNSAGPLRTRSLSMRQLEVFHAIMTTGSMSGAALMLHVSQPALSRALALCESRLGYPLFERTGRRLQATPEALRLHEEARDVYRGLDRLNLLAQRIGASGVATLQIVASATFANSLIPAAIKQLLAHSPNFRIDFRTATYDELPEYLLSGRADVGVSLTQPDHPSLKSQLLGTQRLLCVLPAHHPLADLPSIDPSQLEGTPWIGYPPETPLGELCARELYLDAASAMILVRSPAIALTFAQTGLGAAIVDASCLAENGIPGCVTRPLTHSAACNIWITTSARKPCSVATQHFIDAMRTRVQRTGAHALTVQ